MINCEKLINLVQERPSLWDQRSKSYHNRELKKLWREVAENLRTTDGLVRQKWRGLRDTFRKELSKLEQKRSGDAADEIIESKWQFFNNMFFVKDQFVPRKTTGNIPNSNTQSQTDMEEIESPSYADSQNYDEESDHEIDDTLINTPLPKKRQAIIDTGSHEKNLPKIRKLSENNIKGQTLQKFLAIEEQKLKQFQESMQRPQQQNVDDDSHFLLSLVPFFKDLPMHKKLHVRGKFIDILTKEHELIYRQGTYQQATTSTISQSFTPIPTPSPAYSSSTSEYSLPAQPLPAQPANEGHSLYSMHTTAREDNNTSTYFSNFQPN